MNRSVEEQRLKRDQLAATARALIDNPEAADDEIERVNTELEAAATRLEKLEEVARLSQNPAHVVSPAEGYVGGLEDPFAKRSFMETFVQRRDRALRAGEAAELSATAMETIEEIVGQDRYGKHGVSDYVVAVANPHYRAAYEKFIANPEGFQLDLEPEEAQAMRMVRSTRTMNEGTPTAGGHAVPAALDPSFGSYVTGEGVLNPIEAISRRVTTVSNSWSPVTSGQISASVDGENIEVSDDSPVLDKPTITIYKVATFVPVSIEASQDIPNFAGEVSAVLADGAETLRGQLLISGTGSSQPWGASSRIAATTASRVTRTTGSMFGYPDLYRLSNAIPARHTDKTTFVASQAIVNRIREFGGVVGQGFTVDLQSGPPSFLMGRPVSIASSMTSGVGTNAGYLLLADFSRFVVARRVGMTVEYVSHLFGASNRPTGTRGFYAFERWGSDFIDYNAARQLTG